MIEIIRQVAAEHGMPSSWLVSDRQNKAVVAVRTECFKAIHLHHPKLRNRVFEELFGVSRPTVLAYRRRAGLPQARPGWIREKKPSVAPQNVIGEVSERTGVSVAAILGRSHYRPIAMARHEAIREVARQCPSYGVIDIGKVFRRDHTTISYVLGNLKRRKS